MPLRKTAALPLLAPALLGCPSVPPPRSMVPSAEAALDRMRDSTACGRGVQANAKIDVFGDQGRVRGDLLMFAVSPARLRMDVMSPPPLSSPIAVLTSDGQRFGLYDQREKRFFTGPASACAIARLTVLPVPGHAMVALLRGQAPVLKHERGAGTIEWSPRGYYVVRIPSTRTATEEIHLAPHPSDVDAEWSKQRLRVVGIRVQQYGDVLYHAELEGHLPAPMAKDRIDPEGIDPPIPPSGPACAAEVPRRIHVEVPMSGQDIEFRYDEITWNPPLPEGVFVQQAPPGMEVVPVKCEE
jgi:hypothetical protein